MSQHQYRNQAYCVSLLQNEISLQLLNTMVNSCLIAAFENTGFTLVWLFCWHSMAIPAHNIYSVTHQSVGFTIKEQRECHFCTSVFEQLLFSLCLSLSYSINVKHNNKCIRSEHWLLSYPDTPCLSLIHIRERSFLGHRSSQLFCKGLYTAFHDCNICHAATYFFFFVTFFVLIYFLSFTDIIKLKKRKCLLVLLLVATRHCEMTILILICAKFCVKVLPFLPMWLSHYNNTMKKSFWSRFGFSISDKRLV